MSEVDLPKRLKDYGGFFLIHRIALTTEDIRGQSLPSFEARDKQKDPRYSWFVNKYNSKCVELDAMPPNDLRDRLEGAIREYVDQGAWEQHKLAEEAEKETVRAIMGRMATGA